MRPVAAFVVALFAISACSDSGDPVAAPTTLGTVPPTTLAAADPGAGSEPTLPGTTEAVPTSIDDTALPASTPPLEDIPEIGVPGLDSDDAFCAAWSRWAGSYQVLLVSSAFGTGAPDDLAALEIVASSAVVTAFDSMLSAWPAELESERAVAADAYLGPITRRLAVAREALAEAGADDAAVAAIESAWLDSLGRRDPSTPDFAVELPDEVWVIVDAAAADFADRLVPFAVDPSLVTDVETPLTDDYLAVSCPDRGTLSGQEVDPGATGG